MILGTLHMYVYIDVEKTTVVKDNKLLIIQGCV